MLKYHTVSKNMIFGKQKDDIWLIAGLGNPGLEYEKTRHNAGFMAADKIAEKHGAAFNKHKFKAVYGEFYLGKKRVFLMKPQTYMNASGAAVAEISKFYKIPTENIIIMFDDISLNVGKLRIRRNGTHGGHNGIKDIIELLGTNEIKRIKIGVGERPNREYDLKDWVLGKIPAEQQKELDTALLNAACAAEEIISRGIDSAMNKYNG